MKELIEAAQQQILKHIDEQDALLSRLGLVPNLWTEIPGTSGSTGSLTLRDLNGYRSELENESHKVGGLEAVAAVVGTMKSGKSTTINALVGAEILPSRNQPMTTFPTLIRHNSDCVSPVLLLRHVAPLEQLTDKVQTALHELQADARLESLDQFRDPDGRRLIEDLLIVGNRKSFPSRVEGAPAVRQLLLAINDLFRLAKALDLSVDECIVAYDNINRLPTIEVAFTHLKNVGSLMGRLSVVDTPGPNEAGQGTALREVLNRQLQRASVVISLLDYTQLKSQADAEVRGQVQELREQLNDRLHVAVNKFDQKTSNSMDASEVRSYVAGSLFGEGFPIERVHPVSSLPALLANRARAALAASGQLPPVGDAPWVADFGKEAFGKRWERYLDQPEELAEGVEQVWEDSLYPPFIDAVLTSAFQRAAHTSLDAGLDKVAACCTELELFLGIREEGISCSVAEVKSAIERLHQHIAQLAVRRGHCETLVDGAVAEFNVKADGEFSQRSQQVRAVLNEYFKAGKLQEGAAVAQKREQKENEQSALPRRRSESFFGNLLGFGELSFAKPAHDSSLHFDPNSPEIKFDSEREAAKFFAPIQSTVKKVLNAFDQSLEQANQEARAKIEGELKAGVQKIIDDIQALISDDLKSSGFKVGFRFPPMEGADASNVLREDLTETGISTRYRMVKYTAKVERDSVGGKAKRFFGGVFGKDDWGYDMVERSERETYYSINIRKLQGTVMDRLEQNRSAWLKSLGEYLKAELQPTIDNEFDRISAHIGALEEDLQLVIESKKLGQQSQQALQKALRLLRQDSLDLARKVQESREMLREIKAAEPAAALI